MFDATQSNSGITIASSLPIEEESTVPPHEKTLNGGRFGGVSFIQTLFVIIVSETYLRLG